MKIILVKKRQNGLSIIQVACQPLNKSPRREVREAGRPSTGRTPGNAAVLADPFAQGQRTQVHHIALVQSLILSSGAATLSIAKLLLVCVRTS